MGKALLDRAARSAGTERNGRKKLASEEVAARYAFLRALAAKQHAETVHQTRVKLAFERLCRDYPMLNAAKLWAMAHSSIRMSAGTMHAEYREQRFMAS